MLIHPHSELLREPNLLRPGGKPQGAVKYGPSAPNYTFMYLFRETGTALGATIHDVGGRLNGVIEQSGTDTTYLELAARGLKNTSYDGIYADGMGVAINAGRILARDEGFIAGWSTIHTGGGFSSVYNYFGFGNVLNADKGLLIRSGLATFGSNTVRGIINNRYVQVTDGYLTNVGEEHHYSMCAWRSGANAVYLFRDGIQLAGDEALSTGGESGSNVWGIGAAASHHNRGLNGIMTNCYLIEYNKSIELARSLSENPYQFLVPA